MRDVHPDLKIILARESVSTCMLVDIANSRLSTYSLAVPQIFLTSFIADWTDPATGDIYQATNGLVSTDPPRLSDVLDKESFKIIISDAQYYLRVDFENGVYTGAPMRVRGAFVNNTGTVDLGTQPGAIYNNGIMDVYAG